jgi:hypothetical protein
MFALTKMELDWLTREVERGVAELDSLYDLTATERAYEKRRLLKRNMTILRKRRKESPDFRVVRGNDDHE